MHRRTLLAGLAVLPVTVAGCGGSSEAAGDPETPQSLHIPPDNYEFEEGPDDTTVFVVTVENRGEERRRATMVSVIRGPDGDLISESTDVDVPVGGEETYRVEFDVEWSWFVENRNLQRVEFE